jgi:transketolase
MGAKNLSVGTGALSELIQRSQWLRQSVFELVIGKMKGHIPSSYSMNELVISLYYGGYVQSTRDHAQRDRVIISKGHAVLALYPVLVDKGMISASELAKFTDATGMLRMYADPSIPGIESVTGSLGHGLGIACGHALAAKMDSRSYNTYVILGDGECYEGSVWETLMFAAHHQLNNFCVIVDRNRMCIMDETENCVRLDPLEDKFKSFGCQVEVINGHRYTEILPALDRFAARKIAKPTVILANTVKGKGISFMEDRADWHNKMPSPEQIETARAELKTNPIRD